MKQLPVIAGIITLSMVSGGVPAEPSTRIAWTPETLRFVRGGDPEKGKALAQACQSCHGAETVRSGAEFPALDGQLANYLYRQLRDYKDGSRPNDIMSAIAGGLSDQDMADLAQWYGQQDPLPLASGGTGEEKDLPLVESGDSKRLIPPCGNCHGGDGQGEWVDTPRLAGQNAAYLKQTLLAYQSGQRHNDVYGRMRLMSERLTPEEIDSLAEYYAGVR